MNPNNIDPRNAAKVGYPELWEAQEFVMAVLARATAPRKGLGGGCVASQQPSGRPSGPVRAQGLTMDRAAPRLSADCISTETMT